MCTLSVSPPYTPGLSLPECWLISAEVIKVEAPSGDMMRRGLPQSNGVGSAFATMNRNKKAVCLNLTEPAAVEVARKLVGSADVVMENFRRCVDRLGLGYDSFREDHPKLIYVSISGVARPDHTPIGVYTMRSYRRSPASTHGYT